MAADHHKERVQVTFAAENRAKILSSECVHYIVARLPVNDFEIRHKNCRIEVMIEKLSRYNSFEIVKAYK